MSKSQLIKSSSWDFWLRWVFASFLGFALGGVLGGMALYALAFGEGFAGLLVFGPIFGAVGGTMQSLVLRRKVGHTGWWVLATAIGCTLASVAAELVLGRLPYSAASIISMFTFAIVAGVAGGTLQWLVLHRKVACAGWWVLASILGLTVGIGIGGSMAASLGQAGRAIESTIVFGIFLARVLELSRAPRSFGYCTNPTPAIWKVLQHLADPF